MTTYNMTTYNIVRKKRVFEIWSKNGKLRMPTEDDTISKYARLNSNYPDIGSEHYEKAQELDIDFFTDEKYPYDYIVLGDRAALEEARKGSYLTPYEEFFITLGYGYDGRPFGEFWGIENECFEGYKYGEKQGDFLHWYNNRRHYEEYVKAGHSTPREHHPSVNRDLRELAERNSANARKTKYGRLTEKVFVELSNSPEKSIIRDGYKESDLPNKTVIKLAN